ncbi:MAG: YabP/YqfC family sporulation protein [Lachnospiraceae bacterium]|nr:YabP/YqfC family sporulation protein [Lachnospiraceae bacterium]
MKGKLKEELTESLRLPKDLMFGAVIVTATGDREIYIENYKGLLEYSDDKIKLQTKTCTLTICGKNLVISYYTNDEMKIIGCIGCIRYS